MLRMSKKTVSTWDINKTRQRIEALPLSSLAQLTHVAEALHYTALLESSAGLDLDSRLSLGDGILPGDDNTVERLLPDTVKPSP